VGKYPKREMESREVPNVHDIDKEIASHPHFANLFVGGKNETTLG
jgi:hypothetical protein